MGFRRIGAVLALLLLVGATTPASAKRPSLHQGKRAATEVRDVLADIAEHEDFSQYRKVREQHFDGRVISLKGRIQGGKTLAGILQYFLWSLPIMLVISIVWQNVQRRTGTSNTANSGPTPNPIRGKKTRSAVDTLPAHIPESAQKLWQQGQPRAALSLLYRGALHNIRQQHRLTLPEGATEHDCLSACHDVLNPQAASYFQRLTGAWQDLAYAHRTLDAEAFQTLCHDYPQHLTW